MGVADRDRSAARKGRNHVANVIAAQVVTHKDFIGPPGLGQARFQGLQKKAGPRVRRNTKWASQAMHRRWLNSCNKFREVSPDLGNFVGKPLSSNDPPRELSDVFP